MGPDVDVSDPGPTDFESDVAIIGGCGRVGLPLGIALAHRGQRTVLVDSSSESVDSLTHGVLPFLEDGAQDLLDKGIRTGRLRATTDPGAVARAEHVIVVIGTPVDEHLNPDPHAISQVIAEYRDQFRDGQVLILRSTVYPGVTAMVERLMAELALDIHVAFCPERIAEGRAMVELYTLPQIVASRSAIGRKKAELLFRTLTDKVVNVEPEEAELAKLFTNTWRYIKFATANQLFMMANDFGLDFERVRTAIAYEYPRAADLPAAGFAAGPCLLKDTMQLAAFSNNNFVLGHAAMLVNEGLPLYLVAQLEQQYDLTTMRVGILGMAFKAESDDTRSSLSYKLRRILRFKAAEVLCTDPYVTGDPRIRPLDEVVEQSDLLIIGAPHAAYADIEPVVPIVDVWNLLGQGVRV